MPASLHADLAETLAASLVVVTLDMEDMAAERVLGTIESHAGWLAETAPQRAGALLLACTRARELMSGDGRVH